jgi:hypothetical protein
MATSESCCAEVAATGDPSDDLPSRAALAVPEFQTSCGRRLVYPYLCNEMAEEQNAALAWTRRCATCVLHHRWHAAYCTARTLLTVPLARIARYLPLQHAA